MIPKSSPRVQLILKEFYVLIIEGHDGYIRTMKRISTLFYWEEMRLRDEVVYLLVFPPQGQLQKALLVLLVLIHVLSRSYISCVENK